ncbi:MAG: protein kinase [Bacteroidales bacterium]|nr:protein kinase [Bacteroidales bacterium]
MQGQTINGYTLKHRLGEGGMAEVWYAENEIGKPAAVKVLNENLSRNTQIVERFHNEALVMVKLDHPNIRQVYGYGYIDNRHCIIMEYLDGDDLEALQKSGRQFTDEELRRWWNQTVDALNYTHALGIAHRDIKPSNLFLDKKGNIKLLDFGIAKVKESMSMTRTGMMMGTLMYMSPEQVKDPKRVGPPSDAYSLAVTFVHLLTGKALYDTTTSSEYDIQVSIVNKPVDLSKLNATWQKKLAPYLRKEADNRPPLQPFEEEKKIVPKETGSDTASASKSTKETIVQGGNAEMMPSTAKKKSSLIPWIVAGVACVAAVTAFLFGGRGGNSSVMNGLNDGIQATNAMLSSQIDQKYNRFEELYSKDPEKTGPYWEQAQELRSKANDFINYIEGMKRDLVNYVEGGNAANHLLVSLDTVRYGRRCLDFDLSKLKSGEDTKRSTAFMIGDGNGAELIHNLNGFKWIVEELLGEEDVDKLLGIKGSYSHEEWADENFNQASLAADITTLNKIISNVESAEIIAVNQLLSNINADDMACDEFMARVFAESGYLLSGQTYRAQAMVTAWKNSQLTARVKLDGGAEKEYTSNAQGVIPLEWNVGVGSHKYTGVIDMLDPTTNQMEKFPFEGSFTVAPPAVSVSATKMNVVYRGIDNPIAVGGGVGGEISASASSGSLTRTGNGTYNLRPGEASEVTINVTSGGSSLGSMKFRVKDLPKPVALIRNVVNGQVSKSALQAAGRVEAEMKDFDFDGVHYDVVGYTFSYKTKSGTTKEVKARSGSFTEEIRNVISQANVGDMFVFSSIQVRGNDGKTKTLESPIGVVIK